MTESLDKYIKNNFKYIIKEGSFEVLILSILLVELKTC